MLVERFLKAFPLQQRWGRAGTERAFVRVMQETGLSALDLMGRVEEWRKHKSNLGPRAIAEPPPRPQAIGPADEPAQELPPASPESVRWAEQQVTPYDGEEN
jgi:hypothetical protein